jgi:hypothetical protein
MCVREEGTFPGGNFRDEVSIWQPTKCRDLGRLPFVLLTTVA